jgi:hypothetical protein
MKERLGSFVTIHDVQMMVDRRAMRMARVTSGQCALEDKMMNISIHFVG